MLWLGIVEFYGSANANLASISKFEMVVAIIRNFEKFIKFKNFYETL